MTNSNGEPENDIVLVDSTYRLFFLSNSMTQVVFDFEIKIANYLTQLTRLIFLSVRSRFYAQINLIKIHM